MDGQPVACPVCKSSVTVPGSLRGPVGVTTFTPLWGQASSRVISIPVAGHVCLSCGMVWMSLDLKDIRLHARAHGHELAVQYLDTLLDGPYRGLPDSPRAREAADLIAEIDALLVFGKHAEATRHYRERTGCTWDQAIAKIGEWPRLVRPAKLRLLGWDAEPHEKSAPVQDDHPLRDPWLDGSA